MKNNIHYKDKYQEFFDFMIQEHDLILTKGQIDDIVFEAQRLVEKIAKSISGVSVSYCIENNEFEHYMDIDAIGYCPKCGSIKKYER